MSAISYDVRVWKTWIYRGKTKTTHYVRWSVEGATFKAGFVRAALAESFRADLLAAARRGEAFRVGDGRPVSTARTASSMNWFPFA